MALQQGGTITTEYKVDGFGASLPRQGGVFDAAGAFSQAKLDDTQLRGETAIADPQVTALSGANLHTYFALNCANSAALYRSLSFDLIWFGLT